MIKERSSNQLLQYFSRKIPGECKQLTYTLFRKKVQENPELVRKFDDNVYFKKVHGFLVKTGSAEYCEAEKRKGIDDERKLRGKLGSFTEPSQNNSWQFGRGHMDCDSFRNSSEVYSDFEMEVMSTTINCPNAKGSLRKFLEEDLFISEQSLCDEDLKSYVDLSERVAEVEDCGSLDFSDGRMYE